MNGVHQGCDYRVRIWMTFRLWIQNMVVATPDCKGTQKLNDLTYWHRTDRTGLILTDRTGLILELAPAKTSKSSKRRPTLTLPKYVTYLSRSCGFWLIGIMAVTKLSFIFRGGNSAWLFGNRSMSFLRRSSTCWIFDGLPYSFAAPMCWENLSSTGNDFKKMLWPFRVNSSHAKLMWALAMAYFQWW